MRKIALINQKGGTGKTTSTVNLAGALGELGKRVLVVDVDPQADATAWLRGNRDDADKSLLDVFVEGKPLVPLVHKMPAKGVELVASSRWLVSVEKALAGEVGSEQVLRERFDDLPERWDFVLVDCPPSVGLLVIAALAACNEVIVPVECTRMPLDGVAAILRTVEHVQRRVNPAVTVTGILPCRFNSRRNLSAEVVAALRAKLPELVFETVIREAVAVAEAPGHHQPIHLYDARSPGAEDYAAAARELIARGSKRGQRNQRKR